MNIAAPFDMLSCVLTAKPRLSMLKGKGKGKGTVARVESIVYRPLENVVDANDRNQLMSGRCATRVTDRNKRE